MSPLGDHMEPESLASGSYLRVHLLWGLAHQCNFFSGGGGVRQKTGMDGAS